jgi:hypothetical protein
MTGSRFGAAAGRASVMRRSGLVAQGAIAVLLCVCLTAFSFLSSRVNDNRTELQQLVVTTGDAYDQSSLYDQRQALGLDDYNDFAVSSLKDGLGMSQSDDAGGRYGTRNVNINIIKGGGGAASSYQHQPSPSPSPPAAVSSTSDTLRRRIRDNMNAIRGLQNKVAESLDKTQFAIDDHSSSIAALKASNALLKAQLRSALSKEAADATAISKLTDQETTDVSRLNRMMTAMQKIKAVPGPPGTNGAPGRYLLKLSAHPLTPPPPPLQVQSDMKAGLARAARMVSLAKTERPARVAREARMAAATAKMAPLAATDATGALDRLAPAATRATTVLEAPEVSLHHHHVWQ